MKVTILLTSLFLMSSLFASDYADKSEIEALKERILKLEAQSGTALGANGLKVVDGNGQTAESISANTNRTPASTLSPEKQKELMEKLEAYKKNREEGQKLLDEIDEEGY